MIPKLSHSGGLPYQEDPVLFYSGQELIKQASTMRPDVEAFIEKIEAQKNDLWILVHAIGAGEVYGCFPAGETVSTDRGLKDISALQEGDLVRTHTGDFQPVSSVFSRSHTQDLIRLKALGKDTIRLTANHPVLAVQHADYARLWRKHKGSYRETGQTWREFLQELELPMAFVRADSLRRGDFVVSPVARDEVITEELVEHARLVGHYLAEGCLARRPDRKYTKKDGTVSIYPTKKHTYMVFVLSSETDALIAHELAEWCETNGRKLGVDDSKKRKGIAKSLRLSIHHARMTSIVHEHCGHLAAKKRLSIQIKQMPLEWQRDMVLAYFCGDGHQQKGCGYRKGTLRASTVSKELAYDVQEVLLRLGVISSVHSRIQTGGFGPPNRIYELSVGSSQLQLLSGGVSVYDLESRTPPSGKIKLWRDYALYPVDSALYEPWTGEVYNVEVEGDHSYNVDGLSVHNSNRNGDLTLEDALNHVPPQWTGNPVLDKPLAARWPYGWPTYYNAYVYANHVNKNPKKKIGDVAFVTWDPLMKRVELLLHLYRDLTKEFGGSWALKRMDNGDPVDVSMGMRVPFDLSETETDWAKYYEAVKTYDPRLHKSPGQAVLAYNRRDPIRGLSITRNDYTPLVKTRLRTILPDGSKVAVRNTFPRFFDISTVIIGAERPAKLLWKKASHCETTGIKCAGKCKKAGCGNKCAPSGALVYERAERLMKTAGDKRGSFKKRSLIEKELPSTFNPKAVAGLAQAEESLPRGVLRSMAQRGAPEALSTSALLGIKLKPEEFQRLILTLLGKEDLAEELSVKNILFGPTDEQVDTPEISHKSFSPGLAKTLQKFMPMRSGYEPYVQIRIIQIVARKPLVAPERSTEGVLQKVSAAYNDYLDNIQRNFIKESAVILNQYPTLRLELRKAVGMKKTAAVIGELTQAYLGV